MSFFTPQTKIVEIDAENTITIRKPTQAQKERIAFTASKHQKDGDLAMSIAGIGEGLRLLIVAWDGPAFEGRPVTPENVAELPAEITDMVVDAINGFSGLSGAEKKSSSATTNGA